MKNAILYIKNLRKRPIIKEISWYSSAQVVGQLFAFLGVVIISRYFGPINLGLYSFVQNYVGLFIAVTSGMDFYFQWKIARSENPPKDVLEYFTYKACIIVTLSVLGIVLGFIVLPRDVAIMTAIILTPLWLHASTAFSSYAFSVQRAKLISVLQMVTVLIIFLLKIILVFVKAPLVSFVFIASLELVLSNTLIAAYFIAMPSWRKSIKNFVFPKLISTFLFVYSIRSSLIAVALWQILLRVDQLILATLTSAYTLGIYASAVKIAEVPNFLASTIYVALVSRVAHIVTDSDQESSKTRLRKVMYSYIALSSIISLGVVICAPLLVHVLYGSQFLEAIPVLRMYALTIPGMFLFFFFFSIYGMRDMWTYQAGVFALTIIVNISLIYILMPLFGLVGTAAAAAISYSLAAILFGVHARKRGFIL